MTAPLLSFVVTTHNEAAAIRATILALDAQTGLPGEAEIVMVDDRSTDGTIAEAEAAGSTRLSLFRSAPDAGSPLTTRQQALDLAFRKARGEIVLTVDADSDIPPDWAARMVAPILQGGHDAVAGPIGFAPLKGPLALWQTLDAAQYHLISRAVNGMGAAGGILFGNFAFRRDWYTRVGGFEALGFALTEDLAFGNAVHAAGADIGYAGPGSRIDVRPVPSAGALVRRTLRISSGPASTLAAVLSVWTLSLLVLVLMSLVLAPLWWLAGLRYVAGMALLLFAVKDRKDPRLMLFIPLHEPLVYVLGVAVLWSLARGARVGWGGQSYGR
ncbi:glycosyltransferase [Anianabacter salinae]|uniref:glycosyltransferase n=1 Tax=Anianabacter salinae TaxID=2851023 RepID=UPI00225DD0BB|nr:glycosyltransferase [Anianabacter salinae]MBV0912350.1 glycosyltransferase [Anianabacter salinae]